jgi:hypothetical protein
MVADGIVRSVLLLTHLCSSRSRSAIRSPLGMSITILARMTGPSVLPWIGEYQACDKDYDDEAFGSLFAMILAPFRYCVVSLK